MTNYEALGVRRFVNAAATLTRLGGSLMPPPRTDTFLKIVLVRRPWSALVVRAGG